MRATVKPVPGAATFPTTTLKLMRITDRKETVWLRKYNTLGKPAITDFKETVCHKKRQNASRYD